MVQVILRKNKLFTIDEEVLKPSARKPDILNALYAAVYTEFSGANYNPNYEKLTNLERFNKLNEFANTWLKARGYL